MTAGTEILQNFKLRSTPSRKAIVQLFLKRNYALAHADIEKGIAPHFDRVTVYRTLKTFLDKGLIHKVLDDEGSLKYALCTEACSAYKHHHEHVHFKCTTCEQTICLEVDVPEIKLPRGYRASEQNLLVQGTCAQCATLA